MCGFRKAPLANLRFLASLRMAILISPLRRSPLRRSLLALRVGSRNQARSSIEGEIKKSPLDEHHHAIGKFHQIHQMDEQPREPSQQAGNVKRSNRGHRGGPANHRENAFVAITESRKRSAAQSFSDQ